MNRLLLSVLVLVLVMLVWDVDADEPATAQQTMDDASTGYIGYIDPLDWLAYAGENPYLLFPPSGLPGELISSNFGPLYSDSIDQVPTWPDPEPYFVLPPVSSWVVNPGIAAYTFGLWLQEGQTDVELRFYGVRGMLFKTEEYLFSVACNSGSRFCGVRTAARMHRVEIRSQNVINVYGFGVGENDLSPPQWVCPQGTPTHRYGGGVIYWQRDVPAKFTTLENNGCMIIDLDRPGEDFGWFAWGAGVLGGP